MKKLAFILLIVTGSFSVCAQQKQDSIFYDFNPRYYNTSPCGGCPTGGNKINIKENDKNSPYQYKDQKPIVLKPSDSLLLQWLKSEPVIKEVKKEAEPEPVL